MVSPTGCLSYYLNKSAGSLISLDFGVQATADTSTALFGEGGAQLVSYNNIDLGGKRYPGRGPTPLQNPADEFRFGAHGAERPHFERHARSRRSSPRSAKPCKEPWRRLRRRKRAADAKPAMTLSTAAEGYLDAPTVQSQQPLLEPVCRGAGALGRRLDRRP